VHVILTSQDTGGGGREWILDFIGREELEGTDDQLVHRSGRTDTDAEERGGITRALSVGLARYAALAGLAQGIAVEHEEAEEVPGQPPGLQGEVDDPWDFWVFEIDLEGSLQGEDRDKERGVEASVQASRVTQQWKFEAEVEGDFQRREVELEEDSIFVDESDRWEVSSRLVYSLAGRWSLGADLRASGSTFANRDFQTGLQTGIEYSFFPYEEATRRRLTATWFVGPRYVDYEERTVFGKLSETIYEESLIVELDFRQPWGEASLFGQASHFLSDFEKNRLSLGGELELRIVRGLSLTVEGDVERPRDQVHISAEGATDEEILVRRRQLPSDWIYDFSVGVRISFGSIYNNVVNNRFD
jgi:hypothetical protein